MFQNADDNHCHTGSRNLSDRCVQCLSRGRTGRENLHKDFQKNEYTRPSKYGLVVIETSLWPQGMRSNLAQKVP